MITNEEIYKKVIQFLESKSNDNHFAKHLPTNLIFMSYGGSTLHNTNGINSDFDIRCSVALNEDYILGLYQFDHTKVNNGTEGITTSEDLDVEVFHYDSMVKRLYSGETSPSEMIHTPKEKIIFMNHLFQPIMDNKDLFFSKRLIRHYKGSIYKHTNQMRMSIEKALKPEKIERILTYSYETKEFMKAVLYSIISIEFLESGSLNLVRNDYKDFLDLKHGGIPTIEEAEMYLKPLIEKRDSLLETSSIPDTPDFDLVNKFMKEYQHFIFEQKGFFK